MTSQSKIELIAQVDDQNFSVTVDPVMFNSAAVLITKMDRDMDAGWRLGKRFILTPTSIERCQIAGDRLLTALHSDNSATATLMATYIVSKLPDVKTVVLDSIGEMDNTCFYDHNNRLMQ